MVLDYEGRPLTFLIDSGSSHSFISPSTTKRLRVEALTTGKKLRASLANRSSILTDEQILEFSFQLGGNPTSQEFRILKMGKFQGILRMNWLGKNKAQINCGLDSILFTSGLATQVQIQGRLSRNPVKIVKAKRIVNGFRKGLPIYILKINKQEKEEGGQDPKWLKEYQDIFSKELTNLPPERELVHDIELILGAQPIARAL